MAVIVRNLAAVADAPLVTVSNSHVFKMLASASNADRPFVVAHRYTGHGYSTTVYDALAHQLYRCTHPGTHRNAISALAAERSNIRLLKADEVMKLRVVEDASAQQAAWLD